MENNKTLSIIINGRNDKYNPFFINRLNYVIEHTFYCAKMLNIENEIEFDICDWGSNNSIRNDLKISKENINKLNFYEVPKSITEYESRKKNRFFSFAKANNVAIKRSKAQYLLVPSHDLIFSQTSLLNLFNLLTNKYKSIIELDNFFLNIERIFLPKNLFYKTPSFSYLERWISHSSLNALDKNVLNGGAQGGYLTSKNNWMSLTGIHEKYDGYGFHEFDLFARANMDLNWYDSSNFGISLYKLHRGFAPIRTNAKKNLNTQWTSFKKNTNSENWGLGNLEIIPKKIKQEKIFKEEDIKLVLKERSKRTNFNFLKLNKIILESLDINTSFIKNYISLEEIKYFLILEYIINKYNTIRGFSFIGYEDPFMSIISSSINSTLELFVLDDLENFIATLPNDEQEKNFADKKNTIGLLYKRSILLSECLMKKRNRHLGYFMPITGDIDKIFDNYLTKIPKEIKSNLLIINMEIIKNKNYLKIFNNLNEINSILFLIIKKSKITISYNDIFNNFNTFEDNNDFTILIRKENKEKMNLYNYKLFLFLISTNFILFLVNARKLIKFFLRKTKLLNASYD